MHGSKLSADPSGDPATAVLLTVAVGGQQSTVLAVTANQINLRIPITVDPGVAELRVQREPIFSDPILIRLSRVFPGLFRAIRSDGSTVSLDNPAQPGEGLLVLATGLDSGNLLDSTEDTTAVQLEIDRERVEPLWLRAVDGFPGLYELRMAVPDQPAGNALSVSLLLEGRRSNTLTLPLEQPPDDPSLTSDSGLQ